VRCRGKISRFKLWFGKFRIFSITYISCNRLPEFQQDEVKELRWDGGFMEIKSGSTSFWEPGKLLLNEYVIKKVLGEGAMGTVYHVRRKTGDAEFAVKTLIAAFMENHEQKRLFLRELRTWISLPEHPHLTSCRFFRTIDDRLAIFADYVEGGSLLHWIRDNRVDTVKSILDISIQTAWGLQAAHDLGVVHQDIKPANILMTRSGQARITDFGLSRARMAGKISRQDKSELLMDQSNLVSTGGMTPAYCSPEQAEGGKLDFHTDIWSWGLTLLEMFTGAVTWRLGPMAETVFKQYLVNTTPDRRPEMPESVAPLLFRCFRKDPGDRWQKIEEVADELVRIYEKKTGSEYSRIKPAVQSQITEIRISHDRMNIHGRKWDDPLDWLKDALRAAGRETDEAESLLPARGGSRKEEALVDLEIFEVAEKIFLDQVAEGEDIRISDLAKLFTQKSLVQDHLDDRPGAISTCEKAIDIWERIQTEPPKPEHFEHMAGSYVGKGLAQTAMGNNRDAESTLRKAIAIQEKLVYELGQSEKSDALALVYLNLAMVLRRIGDNPGAVTIYDKAITIWEHLILNEHRDDLESNLAQVYVNKANAMCIMGEFREASPLFDKAVEIRERLVFEKGELVLESKLALVYLNYANAVKEIGRIDDAIDLMDKGIVILERLIFEDQRTELELYLALVYLNKAKAVCEIGNISSALNLSGKGIKLLERIVTQQGRSELKLELAVAHILKAWALSENGEDVQAVKEIDISIDFIRHIDPQLDRRNLSNDLSEALNIKAKSLANMGDIDQSLALFDTSIRVREQVIRGIGRTDLIGDVALTRLEKAYVLLTTGRKKDAAKLVKEALPVLQAEVKTSQRRDLKRGLNKLKYQLKEIL